MRVLVWLGLGVLVYLALRSRARTMQQNMRNSMRAEFEAQSRAGATSAPPGTRAVAPAENMVACAYCQVYLPASEALGQSNQHFCCEEHSRLFATAAPHRADTPTE